MTLSSFSYKTSGWELVELDALRLTNLLVGKNASGKTRIIKALQYVSSILCMKPIVFPEKSFRSRLLFTEPEDEKRIMIYEFEIVDDKVKFEQLTIGGTTLIKRDPNKVVFKGDIVYPPSDKLVVQVRRDKSEYPEIESLMEWADGVVAISCSDINPMTILNGPTGFINSISFSDMVVSLGKEEKKNVIDNAKLLGYDIVDLSTLMVNSDLRLVIVKERYQKNGIMDFQLSSGMMRVLYLLCFLELIKFRKKYSLLLIDDLGEGLDYSRAIHLGERVFAACEKECIQLLASSNDSFLMDVVDISKWQILRRKYSKLTVINKSNTPELFNSFRLTGLSNFDLFSSDYLDNFLDQKAE